MKAAIITVGDELTSGVKPDTNFPRLARRLADLGIEVAIHTSVGDDEIAIARALKQTEAVASIVIVTGGLGPTSDDVTREGIARALGRSLVHDDAVAARLKTRLADTAPRVRDLVLKQAYTIERAEIIMPDRGTAPGMILHDHEQLLYVLPGVPAELEEMLEDSVVPDLRERIPGLAPRLRHTVRTAGLAEAEIEALIADLEPQYPDVRFGFLAHPAIVDIVLTAAAGAQIDLGSASAEIGARLGSAVYAAGESLLEEVVGDLLRSKGLTLATAESCTGGLLAKLLTDVPGSSEYFLGGVVAYADEVKATALEVDAGTLEAHGAVSEPVVTEMATGARTRFGADLAVAISGVAGPAGGTERNPVGTVYICVLDESTAVHMKLAQPGSRAQIRSRAAHAALNQLRLLTMRQPAGPS